MSRSKNGKDGGDGTSDGTSLEPDKEEGAGAHDQGGTCAGAGASAGSASTSPAAADAAVGTIASPEATGREEQKSSASGAAPLLRQPSEHGDTVTEDGPEAGAPDDDADSSGHAGPSRPPMAASASAAQTSHDDAGGSARPRRRDQRRRWRRRQGLAVPGAVAVPGPSVAGVSQPALQRSDQGEVTEGEVTAELVDEEQMRATIREEILAGAVRAEAVTVAVEGDVRERGRDPIGSGDADAEAEAEVRAEQGLGEKGKDSDACGTMHCDRRMAWILVACVLLVVVAVSVGLALGLPRSKGEGRKEGRSNDASEEDTLDSTLEDADALNSTLETVLQRGFLKCSVNDNLAGFSLKNDNNGVEREGTGNAEGFYIDMCRAIAAAVFSDPSRVELVYATTMTKYQFIADKKADLSMRGDTHTFERDVHQSDTGIGFTFSTPFLYDGTAFAGVPDYVSCAENRDTSGPCADLKVCVSSGTTWREILRGMLPGSNVYETDSIDVYFRHMLDGDCNAVAAEKPYISMAAARSGGYNGPYALGGGLFSKEPLAIVSRDDDPGWSDFLDAIVQALLHAERNGITQDTADLFPQTDRFGERHRNMFRHALAASGNYGELYDRNLEPIIPRNGINSLNDGQTGLIYAHPLGKLHVDGPGPAEGGALERILVRGRLLCGIAASDISQAIDAEGSGLRVWRGLDADFCRAMAAAIFEGASDMLEFIEVSSAEVGFEALMNGDIDILSGFSANVDTEHGFSFSQPYYYGPVEGDESKEETHALGVLENDPQFSAFVYWVVAATFHAEEAGITQDRSFDMPAVNLFGPTYTRMFRDAILTVGNYAEIYGRNEQVVAAMPPRQGRNLLNASPFGPQHHPFSFTNI